MRKLSVIFLMILTGCASTPAPPSEPTLPTGPLHGRLERGMYHDMHGWFGVSTPIPTTDPAYATLGVSEEYQPNVSFVNFAAAPGEYYRAYVEDFYGGNHPVTSLDKISDSAMKLFGKGMMDDRKEPVKLVEEKPWHTSTTTGYLRLYTERAPLAPMLTDLGLAEDYTAYILMYVTVDNGKVAVLWMEWPMDCKPCIPYPTGAATASDDPIDKALAADGRSGAFMTSFHFGKD